jgi:hypothetical protein
MAVAWQPGETAPDPAVVASLQSLPSGTGLVLELSAPQLPADASSRAELAEYAASLARQTPSLRDLVLTPAPSVSSAAGSADALAAVRAAVVEARPDVGVGPLFDGSTAQPQRTVQAFGQELGHDGSRADLVAFRPAAVPEAGLWGAGALVSLETALAKGFGTAPPVLVEVVATPTTVPSSELTSYTGGKPPIEGAVSPATQASTYAAAIGAASCSANVRGVLLDRLVDYGAAPEPATGLYFASGDPKPSAAAVKEAIRAVSRGAVVCPGLARRVTATTLTFPQRLSGLSASVVLGCNRDCLYLVTLDRADGQPVAASRGALNGGDPARSITLPTRRLRSGGYQLDVRLVSRVDPGAVTRQLSGLLTVG